MPIPGDRKSARAARSAAMALLDPRLQDKLFDVVGLSLDPPEHALVLSRDEKIDRALNRTQRYRHRADDERRVRVRTEPRRSLAARGER